MTRFFIAKPTPTTSRVARGWDKTMDFPAYRTADGRLLAWSGEMPLPEIGAHIFITMNGIGWAYVEGYFEEEGYVGVMTRATNPPKWLRDQRRRLAKDMRQPEWARRGIGCEFGAEIALKRPRKVAA